jgi:thiol-disulfide isomerase/thioredoxin
MTSRILSHVGFLFISLFFLGAMNAQAASKFPDLAPLQYLGSKPELAGKPAIIEFWATWCPPCRKSIPHLNELNKKYKDKGLVIVGISNESSATIEKFTKSNPINYYVGLDPKSVYSQKLGVDGIPHAFLLDKTGTIVWDGHPMELTDAAIEKALK